MIEARNGVSYVGFPDLAPARAAFSLRLGGHSQTPYHGLNVSYAVGDDTDAVASNRVAFCSAIGIDPASVVSAQLVHGTTVARVGVQDRGRGFADRVSLVKATDALITDQPDVFLWLTFGDCVPILFCDPSVPAVGLAHAGWKGTLAGVAAETVRAMCREFGSSPERLSVAIGPSIGPCCYEVREDVAAATSRSLGVECSVLSVDGPGRYHLDLWSANRLSLLSSGVLESHITVSGLCTSCRTDVLFSHRRESGRTGRMAATIGLPADGSSQSTILEERDGRRQS